MGDMARHRRTPHSSRAEYAKSLALINARCVEADFDTAAVAAHLNLSTRQVQRIFQLFGTTVRAELTDARMRLAVTELMRLRAVAPAARGCGYPNPRHFSRAFFRYYRVQPRVVVASAKLAARLRRKAAGPAPSPTSPAHAYYFRAWRADHRRLVRLLRTRRPGTPLDGAFADALALRGPDLRTTEGRARATDLSTERSRRQPSGPRSRRNEISRTAEAESVVPDG
jgi:AraC-like DNA-binding protein